MNRKILCLLVAGLFSGGAFAADDFTGFHVGLDVGRASGDSRTTQTLGGNWSIESAALRNFVTNNAAADLGPSGTNYGLQFGYDHQFANDFVLGIEVDYSKLNLDEARQAALLPSGAGPSYAFSNRVDASHAYSVRPKFGYAFDQTMVYATAGWSRTSVDTGADLVSNGGYNKVGSASEKFSSTIWGVGVEHKFADNWSGRLEYLKTKGDDVTYTSTYRAGSTFPGYSENYHQDLDYHVIRLGVSYRF